MRRFNQEYHNEIRKQRYQDDPEYREHVKNQIQESRKKDPLYKKEKYRIKIVNEKQYVTVAYFVLKYSVSKYLVLKTLQSVTDKISESSSVGPVIFYNITEAETLFQK